MTIDHISDTARWVAYYRAMETERPDAIFSDPFARRLAGLKGEEIVDTMKQGRTMAWAMIVRTAVFDEIIMSSIAERGVDTVLNIAAGLDTRPWRLNLPPKLRWFDVDLPGILAYKTDTLRGEKPKCEYEAIAADITDEKVRREIFARVGAAAKDVLVVTEGLLIYLTPEQVAALATDLAHQPAFCWWLIDIASPRLLKFMTRSWGKAVEKGNAPFKFAPAEGTEFYRPLGWREVEFHAAMEEAKRLHREMKFMPVWRLMMRLYPKKTREELKRMSGFVLLTRNDVTSMFPTPVRSRPAVP
jgi:methyltransferase (TIGR00027 family)